MTRLEILRALRVAMADPTRVHDVAVLKGALTGSRASARVEARLDAVRGFHPVLDLDALASLPSDTFGHAAAGFLRTHGLSPFVPGDRLAPELLRENAFLARYGAIHDLVHVLLGFGPDWPGEVGVWAFVGAQRWSWGMTSAAVVALLVSPLRVPLRLGDCWRAFRRGWDAGRRAELLIAVRLEDHLERPLDAVRAELGIPLPGPLPPPLRVAA
jgi:ubiquinone biosynthesis protein COQ4